MLAGLAPRILRLTRRQPQQRRHWRPTRPVAMAGQEAIRARHRVSLAALATRQPSLLLSSLRPPQLLTLQPLLPPPWLLHC